MAPVEKVHRTFFEALQKSVKTPFSAYFPSSILID